MKQYQEEFNLSLASEQAVKKSVENLTDFVNTLGSCHEENEFFVFMLTQGTHRTLQQNAFRLMWQCVKGWAETPDNRVDQRNEATVKACREIVKTQVFLPFI